MAELTKETAESNCEWESRALKKNAKHAGKRRRAGWAYFARMHIDQKIAFFFFYNRVWGSNLVSVLVIIGGRDRTQVFMITRSALAWAASHTNHHL